MSNKRHQASSDPVPKLKPFGKYLIKWLLLLLFSSLLFSSLLFSSLGVVGALLHCINVGLMAVESLRTLPSSNIPKFGCGVASSGDETIGWVRHNWNTKGGMLSNSPNTSLSLSPPPPKICSGNEEETSFYLMTSPLCSLNSCFLELVSMSHNIQVMSPLLVTMLLSSKKRQQDK